MARRKETQKESNKKLVAIMEQWQDIEVKSIASLRSLIKKVKNPLVKQVLKIIQRDSVMHQAVQQFIVDSLEKKAITLTPEELAAIWSGIEEHIKMERATVKLGQRAKETSANFVHRYFINYLMADERKHEEMLEQLDNIKRKMYPYA
ncbi:hypothetical protein ACFL5V_02190 [Fibrobacterota bacterium]